MAVSLLSRNVPPPIELKRSKKIKNATPVFNKRTDDHEISAGVRAKAMVAEVRAFNEGRQSSGKAEAEAKALALQTKLQNSAYVLFKRSEILRKNEKMIRDSNLKRKYSELEAGLSDEGEGLSNEGV